MLWCLHAHAAVAENHILALNTDTQCPHLISDEVHVYMFIIIIINMLLIQPYIKGEGKKAKNCRKCHQPHQHEFQLHSIPIKEPCFMQETNQLNSVTFPVFFINVKSRTWLISLKEARKVKYDDLPVRLSGAQPCPAWRWFQWGSQFWRCPH